ncbi:YqjF family protein [Peribacillus sp. SCS-155]|uniref:YqjF family protein n=1 Tax=Peribacillus sedimenti TaxID=3115297 RepID=UPI003906B52F
MHKEFKQLNHRPFPLPKSPWILTQVWNDLLFMHWPVKVEDIRKLVPDSLEIDTFKGEAWVSIIPFYVTGMRARYLPPIPMLNQYTELNVRTYVRYQGIPGIYFFSLDADHPLAVLGAKLSTGLPYRQARMKYNKNNNQINFYSNRIKNNKMIDVNYYPESGPTNPLPGTLDNWLLERYCMYSFIGENMFRGDIHHDKWAVASVQASVSRNTMFELLEGNQNSPPLMHYCKQKQFFFFPLKKLK